MIENSLFLLSSSHFVTMILSPSAFLWLGWDIIQHIPNHIAINHAAERKKIETVEKEFRSTFGVSSDVASHVWEYLVGLKKLPRDSKAKPSHLLWCLLFLKKYETESFLSTFVRAAENTFRKWVWLIVDSISSLYNNIVSCMYFQSESFTTSNNDSFFHHRLSSKRG